MLSEFAPATVDEITKLVLDSADKQCDLDPIPTALLKKCIHSLAPVITKLVNLSLSCGAFPKAFKHAIVTPLHKKPSLDKESLSNYRPISNLSFVSKLLERVVLKRLSNHLSTNDLFNNYQSAYTQHRSTETVLLSVYNEIVNAMSSKSLTGLCMLDLSAAFDTIDHKILLERLSSWFGIKGTVLSWLTSFVSDRTFSVKVLDNLSSSRSLEYGVPQGSVLGPLLFSLYTAPLSKLVSSTSLDHHLFADDTQMFTSFTPSSYSESVSVIQSTFQSVSLWMSANFLDLNPSKTEFIVFGTPQQLQKLSDPVLKLSSDVIIKPATSVRNLGVILDKNLTFHDHISMISQSCFYHIRDLRRIRPFLDSQTAATIGTALVQSKLDYCNSLFLNLPACEINRLQFIQNSLARAVFNRPKFAHVTDALKSLHWLKVRERIVYKNVSLAYKLLSTTGPQYLSKLIAIQQPGKTRSTKLVSLDRPVTSRCKLSNRSFQCAVPQIWNSLPSSLRSRSASNGLALPPAQFHKQLKTYLFSLSFPDCFSNVEARPSRKPPFH